MAASTSADRWLRRAQRIAAAGLAAVALALVTLLLVMHLPPADPDAAAVRTERAHRLALSKAGATLPGTPDLDRLDARLTEQGFKLGAPVFIRIFKREFELELWLKSGDRYRLFATYPVCRWSGLLGPKITEGDHQAPEGFYTVDRGALNPHSRWHRSFNLGFPNAFDRAHARTGSWLMVHGGCSSVGCFAMTNPAIDEIWRLVAAALRRGQGEVNVHVFPFRMTDEALAARKDSRWSGFWAQLKPAFDTFEATGIPPRISVCQGRYQIAAGTLDRSAKRDGCTPGEEDAPT